MPLSTLTDGRGRNNFPLTLEPLAWYYAAPQYFVFDDTDPTLVGSWRCRTGKTANTLSRSGASHPRWSPGGWGPGVGALDFDGAAAFLFNTSAVGSAFSGSDVPFSCLLTARIDASGDHGILYWLNSGGTARSHWRTNNAPPEQHRYNRIDDAGTSVTRTGTLDIGTSNTRM